MLHKKYNLLNLTENMKKWIIDVCANVLKTGDYLQQIATDYNGI